MSRLSTLVKYRELILDCKDNQFDSTPFSHNQSLISKLKKDHGLKDDEVTQLTTISNHYNDLDNQHKKIKPLLDNFSKDIEQLIDNEVNSILNDRLYRDYHLAYDQGHKKLDNDIVETEIFSILKKYISDWRYPGLLMYPQSMKIVSKFVTLDPLYILFMNTIKDQHILDQYPAQYQNRVRRYEVNSIDFKSVPKEQMAVVYSHDLLKLIDSRLIDSCITNVFSLLKPGGIFAFGYINSDSSDQLDLFEFERFSYYNNRKLKNIVNKLGAELVLTKEFNDYGSLAIIKRPGKLKTLKAHQALGLVKNIAE